MKLYIIITLVAIVFICSLKKKEGLCDPINCNNCNDYDRLGLSLKCSTSMCDTCPNMISTLINDINHVALPVSNSSFASSFTLPAPVPPDSASGSSPSGSSAYPSDSASPYANNSPVPDSVASVSTSSAPSDPIIDNPVFFSSASFGHVNGHSSTSGSQYSLPMFSIYFYIFLIILFLAVLFLGQLIIK
jgi:hypothetical protein